MKIIGCDFHPSFRQKAICDLETGVSRAEVEPRRRSGGAVLRGVGGAGVDRDRGDWKPQWFLDLAQRWAMRYG